jgi:hypothetical protein
VVIVVIKGSAQVAGGVERGLGRKKGRRKIKRWKQKQKQRGVTSEGARDI